MKNRCARNADWEGFQMRHFDRDKFNAVKLFIKLEIITWISVSTLVKFDANPPIFWQ